LSREPEECRGVLTTGIDYLAIHGAHQGTTSQGACADHEGVFGRRQYRAGKHGEHELGMILKVYGLFVQDHATDIPETPREWNHDLSCSDSALSAPIGRIMAVRRRAVRDQDTKAGDGSRLRVLPVRRLVTWADWPEQVASRDNNEAAAAIPDLCGDVAARRLAHPRDESSAPLNKQPVLP
jgi:hypothetical protein